MKVILLTDIQGKGKKGQLAEVSEGYARNYLFPRKMASEANADALNAIKSQDEAKRRKAEQEKKAAAALSEKLKSTPVKIYAKAGAGGRLFGSVTTKEISEALKAQHGIELDKHKLAQDDPIKNFGTFEVKARLYPEITGTVYVIVAEA
ncbi:MAG: 50S ribosomal protein L9 [Bacillota bacterium]|nr:50S ribosomal protein L9 [Bacillota bacterium]